MILGFIGIKLIIEALHGSGFTTIPEVGILPSLGFIVATLAVTAIASLTRPPDVSAS